MRSAQVTSGSRSEVADPEAFSISHATIIIGIHLLSLGGISFYSAESLFLFIVAHYFFFFFGMSLGFHRLLSHNAYIPNPHFKKFVATVGTLCFQGGPLFWAGLHREHHIRNEGRGDAHSAKRGFWWSHMGWLFFKSPNGFSYVKAQRLIPDIVRRPYLRWLERNSVKLNITVLIFLAALFGAIDRWDLFFWVGPIRILSVWHSTWLLNSYAHGARFTTPRSNTRIRNSILINLLFPGEGMHLNHHNEPNNPCYSKKWHEVDPVYGLLVLLQQLKLVKLPVKTNVRLASKATVTRSRID